MFDAGLPATPSLLEGSIEMLIIEDPDHLTTCHDASLAHMYDVLRYTIVRHMQLVHIAGGGREGGEVPAYHPHHSPVCHEKDRVSCVR